MIPIFRPLFRCCNAGMGTEKAAQAVHKDGCYEKQKASGGPRRSLVGAVSDTEEDKNDAMNLESMTSRLLQSLGWFPRTKQEKIFVWKDAKLGWSMKKELGPTW